MTDQPTPQPPVKHTQPAHLYQQKIERLEAERDALAAKLAPLAAFWRKVSDNVFDGCDSGDLQEWAVEAGLFERVLYDPEKHGEVEYAESGEDTIFVHTQASKAALEAKP